MCSVWSVDCTLFAAAAVYPTTQLKAVECGEARVSLVPSSEVGDHKVRVVFEGLRLQVPRTPERVRLNCRITMTVHHGDPYQLQWGALTLTGRAWMSEEDAAQISMRFFQEGDPSKAWLYRFPFASSEQSFHITPSWPGTWTACGQEVDLVLLIDTVLSRRTLGSEPGPWVQVETLELPPWMIKSCSTKSSMTTLKLPPR